MKGHQLKLDRSGLELGTKGKWGFPVSGGKLQSITHYDGRRFESHFHPEPELTLIEEGEMYYRANEETLVLRRGDGIFVNVNVMHAGWQRGESECLYQPMNFSPRMVFGYDESEINTRYVAPLVGEEGPPFLVFRAERAEDAPALALIRELRSLLVERREGYELLVKSLLCRFWLLLYQRARTLPPVCPAVGAAQVKKAIAFMEAHYTEEITLDGLAAEAHLSRSGFCHAFHRFTGRTPFAYLQHLRVRRSLPLLLSGEWSVAEVAAKTGFSGASYYAEVFRRFMGTSPLQYKKRGRG